MPDEHFEFDMDEQVLRFKSPAAAVLLHGFLTRGKFGDYLDPILVLNPILSDLLNQLGTGLPDMTHEGSPSGARFSSELLSELGQRIAEAGGRTGWWKMSHDEKVAYISGTVATPHSFCDEDIQIILDSVESTVFRARRLLDSMKPDA